MQVSVYAHGGQGWVCTCVCAQPGARYTSEHGGQGSSVCVCTRADVRTWGSGVPVCAQRVCVLAEEKSRLGLCPWACMGGCMCMCPGRRGGQACACAGARRRPGVCARCGGPCALPCRWPPRPRPASDQTPCPWGGRVRVRSLSPGGLDLVDTGPSCGPPPAGPGHGAHCGGPAEGGRGLGASPKFRAASEAWSVDRRPLPCTLRCRCPHPGLGGFHN